MKKVINFGGKDYTLQSSAYTQFKYRDVTGRKLIEDVNRITELRKNKDGIIEALDDFIEILMQITYVMIEESDPKQVNSFEDFMKSIDNLFEDTKWVEDVTELAVTPISGGNKRVSPQTT